MVELGYHVTALVTTRDWSCMVESQVNSGHVKNIFQAKSQIKEAYEYIFTQLNASGVYYETVSYESLVHRPTGTLNNISKTYQLNFPTDHGIKDGNEKYYSKEDK